MSLSLNEDGTLSLTAGTPDIGGLRASLCMMAAEELKVPLDKIRVQIGDTGQLGYNFLTGGSRATFSSGMATVEAAREVMKRGLQARRQAVGAAGGRRRVRGRRRASGRPQRRQAHADDARGHRRHRRQDRRADRRLRAHQRGGRGAELRHPHRRRRGRPRDGHASWVVRYTAIQDAGRAIHPSYVEGQYQGGAAQGIGWALNEEYIYGADGKLQNAGFLDYRVPVASDLPMIDTVIVEVPNPRHPYGVRGVGETPIVPPMATIANAVANATGVRFTELPMSPPKVLKALDAARAKGTAKM